MRSAGFRFFTVALLALLMFIPLFFVSAVVDDRQRLARSTVSDIGADWGGPQLINGPRWVIPVQGPTTRNENREVTGDDGTLRTETVAVTRIMRKDPIHVAPDVLSIALTTETSERKRGIFTVPVYTGTATLTASFPRDLPELGLAEGDQVLWDRATLVLGLNSNKGLRGEASLMVDGTARPLEPRAGVAGIQALTADPRGTTATLVLGFNGAESLQLTPTGRITTVEVTSDWPHPSFTGAFLPNDSEISDAGFAASWTIPHLARPLPQVARSSSQNESRRHAFGVSFFQPNNFYQKAYRAGRYGILFIALTFLTVLLIENRAERPTHPVQYILIGLAQALFVLLMVAYAEQVGFLTAYVGSALATIALLTLFAATALRMGQRSLVLAALLLVLYAVLYLILQSTDYALLAGATLAFVALAGAMILTRNEDWYGPAGPAEGWRRKKEPKDEA